jgi:hypothetical protein
MFRAMFSPIIRSTWLYLEYLVLFTQVVADWCLGWVETELCGLWGVLCTPHNPHSTKYINTVCGQNVDGLLSERMVHRLTNQRAVKCYLHTAPCTATSCCRLLHPVHFLGCILMAERHVLRHLVDVRVSYHELRHSLCCRFIFILLVIYFSTLSATESVSWPILM